MKITPLGCFWSAPAAADVITVDGNVVPFEIVDPDGFAFDQCTDTGFAESVKCDYDWEQGIELVSPDVALFGDKWFDGHEAGAVPETGLDSADGDVLIQFQS